MIREVDLVNYLPPYLQEFKEITVCLEAENPEFTLAWEATDQVLKNEYIETADEYGISRFEGILGIVPSSEDTLESRRARVLARWFDSIPYTIRMLVQKLKTICEDSDFTLTYDFETGYTLTLITDLETYGQVEELEKVLNSWVPANIVCETTNAIPCEADGDAYFSGGIAYADEFFITTDFRDEDVVAGEATFTGGIVNTVTVMITNDFKSEFEMAGSANLAAGTVMAELIGIND